MDKNKRTILLCFWGLVLFALAFGWLAVRFIIWLCHQFS
jgi:hypothetical protein